MGDSKVYGPPQISSNPWIIDTTDTEAFLVRKASDGGDVFTVDTATVGIKLGSAGNLASLWWSDMDTRLYELTDDNLRWQIAGTTRWQITGSFFGAAIANGGSIRSVASTATIPAFVPNFTNFQSGIGSRAAHAVTFISNSVEGPSVQEDSGIAAMYFPEVTTPTAITNYGSVYPKADNNLYFQDGAGTEHLIGGVAGKTKSYSHSTGSTGTHFMAGYYDAPAADVDLTQASLTQTVGSANGAYGAHLFVVSSAVGTTDGSDLVLTATGTTITDAGVRNSSASVVIVADATAESTDDYTETSEKWLGQPTLTLSSTGGSTFAYTFNYGFAKYEDFGNTDVTITGFEVTGEANANDAGYNITLCHHKTTGWTYHASAFIPGSDLIVDMNADYNTEVNLVSGDHFAYKRTGLSVAITSSGSEGVLIRETTNSANSIEHADYHITYDPD